MKFGIHATREKVGPEREQIKKQSENFQFRKLIRIDLNAFSKRVSHCFCQTSSVCDCPVHLLLVRLLIFKTR